MILRSRRAAFLGLFIFAAAPELFAQGQQQYANGPGSYLTWNPTPRQNEVAIDVTYFIGAGFTNPQENVIRNAAAAWNAALGSINLVEVGSAAAAGIDIVQGTIPTQFATIINSTLMGTFPGGATWSLITDVTAIVTDNQPPPLGTGSPVGGGQIDFTALMIDLFGRSLGLGFAGPGDPLSVMRPNFGTGPQNRTLSADDIAALAQLYGTPEPATWALFGVGLLALGGMKRRRMMA
jgi:hypothetical protein